MIEHLGFTGTKAGMTGNQSRTVAWLLKEFSPANVHHGDCVGADEQFHVLAGMREGVIRHVHPPDEIKYRAFCDVLAHDVLHPPKPYLRRNKDIVDACSVLIAAPAQNIEILRSGTWSTVRFAKTQLPRPRIIIVRPDGTHYDT